MRAARQRAGLSQEQLAEKSGLARGTIQLIEQGTTKIPHPETILVLAKSLGVPMEDLLAKEQGDPPGEDGKADLGGAQTLGVSEQTEPAIGVPESRRFGRLPPRPSAFVGRSRELTELRERLMRAARSLGNVTVAQGLPGVGKTTLAAVLCRDAELEDEFADGVLWWSLGKRPDVHGALVAWARAVGLPAASSRDESAQELSERLTYLFRNKRVLFVVDDLWAIEDLSLLRVGGSGSAMLVTTRQASLADEVCFADGVYHVGILDDAAGLELLETLAPHVVAHHRSACQDVVAELEGLPLAIHVAASLLRAEARRGFGVEDLLSDLRKSPERLYAAPLPSVFAGEVAPSVARLLSKSTDLLDDEGRRRFAELGVLAPKPAVFDENAAREAWLVDDPRPYLAEFVDRGLLEVPEPGKFQMHSLLRLHANSLWDQVRGLDRSEE